MYLLILNVNSRKFYDIYYSYSYLKLNISIRDYLIWVKFIETMMNQLQKDNINCNSLQAVATFYKEGAIMIFLDKKTKKDLM